MTPSPKKILPLTLVALAAVAPAASAAYAPHLAIQITPTTFSAAPQITSTITQAAGQTASKTVVVDFPRGYSANLGETLSACSSAQESSNSCPDSSRMGTAHADASLSGIPLSLDGNVYFGGISPAGFKMIVILSNALLGTQTIEGISSVKPDGTIETVFDNLPNVLTTTFRLGLDGGAHSLLLNPAACGSYTFSAHFTSQSGETAASSAGVTIDGCPPPPPPLAIQSLVVSPEVVRAGRPASLSFTLTRAATVDVVVRGPLGRHRHPRTHSLTVSFMAGADSIGNIARGLAAGRYTVTATTESSPPSSASATFVVKAAARRRARHR